MKPKLTRKERGALMSVRDMLDTGLIEGPRTTSGHYVRNFFSLALRRIFNMSVPAKSTNCGTVACIGGWTGAMMGMDLEGASAFVRRYENTGKFHDLFYPLDGNATNFYAKIQPHHAVVAIDNFLRTGKPRWEKVLPKSMVK